MRTSIVFWILGVMLLGFTLSCNVEHEDVNDLFAIYRVDSLPQKTIFQGRIEGNSTYRPSLVNLKYSVLLHTNTVNDVAQLDNDQFYFEVAHNTIQQFRILIDEELFGLIVKPGSTVDLVYNVEDKTLKCSNDKLVAATLGIVYKIANEKFWSDLSTTKAKSYPDIAKKYEALKQFDKRLQSRVDSIRYTIEDLPTADQLIVEEFFRQFVRYRIDRSFQFEIFQARREGLEDCIATGKQMLNLLNHQEDELTEMAVLSDAFIDAVHSTYIINSVISNCAERLADQNQDRKSYPQRHLKEIESWFSGNDKESIFLRNNFSTGFLLGQSEVPKAKAIAAESARAYIDGMKAGDLKNRLLKAYSEKQEVKASVDHDIDIGSIIGAQVATDSVIVVDIFATWCQPCLQAFSDKLKDKKYWVEKGVKFIYLCMKSNYENYLDIKEKYALGDDCYFIDGSQQKQVSNAFSYTAYPSYFLIRNGKLVNNSPAQSLSEVKQLIESRAPF